MVRHISLTLNNGFKSSSSFASLLSYYKFMSCVVLFHKAFMEAVCVSMIFAADEFSELKSLCVAANTNTHSVTAAV